MGILQNYFFFVLAALVFFQSHVYAKNKTTTFSQIIGFAGDDVNIPPDMTVIIDNNYDLGFVNIEGQVRCPETGNFTLKATGFHVHGAKALFECGTPESRFKGNLKIEIKPGYTMLGTERNFMAMDGGTIRMAGLLKNSGWLRLAKTTAPGDRQITLSRKVQWSIGDRIMLSPTSYKFSEAEENTIIAIGIDGQTVTLASPIKYQHWGQNQIEHYNLGNHSWSLDESAEVANLTRNIQIYPSGTDASLDYIGTHMMIMKSAKAYVDAVEFYHMGQMGKMGRYPFHWHLAGDVNGQYIVNSSIHHSFQRCVTVHGTHRALVKNNVCFDHYGHGYFLEDGNEIGNRIIGNLGVLSRVPLAGRTILTSDADRSQAVRFAGPATFWISNPNNNVSGNVAAGSEGTGFWMSFSSGIYCVEDGNLPCKVPDALNPTANRFPRKANTLRFDSNKASAAMVGISWDGAPDGDLTKNPLNPADRFIVNSAYEPTAIPTFNGLKTFKTQVGIYFRGSTARYDQTVNADNLVSLFFAYNQIVNNSLVVALSSNFKLSELEVGVGFHLGRIGGIYVYDGPFELNQVDFVNFPSSQLIYKGYDVTPSPILIIGGANRFTNRVTGLQFSPEPYRRVDFTIPTNWVDSLFSTSIRDIDGSLGGMPGALIVPDQAYNSDPSCESFVGRGPDAPATGVMKCAYNVGLVIFDQIMPSLITRDDGATTMPYDKYNYLFSKFNVILNSYNEYSYEVNIYPSVSQCNSAVDCQTWKRPKAFSINFQTEELNEVSPVLKFKNLGNCNLEGEQVYNNLDSLKASKVTSYYANGTDIYVKLNSRFQGAQSGYVKLSCL